MRAGDAATSRGLQLRGAYGNDGNLGDHGVDSDVAMIRDGGDHGVAVLRAVMYALGVECLEKCVRRKSSRVLENNTGASALDSGVPMKAV